MTLHKLWEECKLECNYSNDAPYGFTLQEGGKGREERGGRRGEGREGREEREGREWREERGGR